MLTFFAALVDADQVIAILMDGCALEEGGA